MVLHPSELQAERNSRAFDSDALEVVESLTTRERDVLQMLARGLGNKEIAVRLKISEHTVKFHVASILGKLGASTRTDDWHNSRQIPYSVMRTLAEECLSKAQCSSGFSLKSSGTITPPQ